MGREKRLKTVATVNVDAEEFRERRHNKNRTATALKLIELAKKAEIDCLCIPAGYLLAKNEKEIPKLIRPILSKAKKFAISFVIGVDTSAILRHIENPDSPAMHRLVKQGKMPCFLCSYSVEQNSLQIHRQRSCTSIQANKRLIPDDIIKESRYMPLGASGFQIILCGEVYDKRLLAKGKPKAAVVFGHTTMPRLSRTLASKSKLGFSIINTEHRTGRNGKLFCFDKGRDRSVIAKPCAVEKKKGPWIDIAVWDLNVRRHFQPSKLSRNSILFEE